MDCRQVHGVHNLRVKPASKASAGLTWPSQAGGSTCTPRLDCRLNRSLSHGTVARSHPCENKPPGKDRPVAAGWMPSPKAKVMQRTRNTSAPATGLNHKCHHATSTPAPAGITGSADLVSSAREKLVVQSLHVSLRAARPTQGTSHLHRDICLDTPN